MGVGGGIVGWDRIAVYHVTTAAVLNNETAECVVCQHYVPGLSGMFQWELDYAPGDTIAWMAHGAKWTLDGKCIHVCGSMAEVTPEESEAARKGLKGIVERWVTR